MSATAFQGLDPCVHCGFCLQSCPTFLVTGDEADSPRGRIVLMQEMARGALAPTDDALTHHLDRCLGCRGCEPVCPSGVTYGLGLEAARAVIADARGLDWLTRLVLLVMAEPILRTPAMWLARLARPLARWFAGASRLGFAWGMLDATRPASRAPSDPPRASGPGAIVFEGCVMSGLFSHVNRATARVLGTNGFALESEPGQGCCGALHVHAGAHRAARDLARANVRALARHPHATIVVNSAGCGAMLKEYGALLADEPEFAAAARSVSARVRDVSEVLAAMGPRPGAPLDRAVAYDPPCHLAHAQRVSAPMDAMLGAIPGLRRVPHAEAWLCCGSAGIYSLVEPGLSREVLARKVSALAAAGPEIVVTGNPGCLMQIGAGLTAAGMPCRVAHPVELLDESYARQGYYDDVRRV